MRAILAAGLLGLAFLAAGVSLALCVLHLVDGQLERALVALTGAVVWMVAFWHAGDLFGRSIN